MIEILKDRRTALWAAVGMLFLYQTPKTVAVIGGLSRWDGPAAVAEGIAFSMPSQAVHLIGERSSSTPGDDATG